MWMTLGWVIAFVRIVKCAWSNMLMYELHHYELLSVSLRLRYSSLTSPALVYDVVYRERPSVNSYIARV